MNGTLCVAVLHVSEKVANFLSSRIYFLVPKDSRVRKN